MKIRTINDLQDMIDRDLAWRRKELSSIKSNIKEARSFAKNTALRSGIALLYAHWEGFIKNAATYYLCYISCQKIPYKKLKENFFALSIKNQVSLFEKTNKATLHNKILKSIFDQYNECSQIPYENIVKTQSNLNSSVFKEIMAVIGLDCTDYESSYNLIDEVLLNMRNNIAHGDKLEVMSLDEDRFNEIYNIVTRLIERFSTQIMNAAVLKEYIVKVALPI